MNNSVAVFIPQTTLGHTAGKFIFFAKALQQAGFDTTVLCWSDEAEKGARENGLACVQVRASVVQVDRVKEAQKLHVLLDKPFTNRFECPTWGDLLAYDDFVGLASGIKIEGMRAFRPGCLVGPMNGMEEATVEDEHMRLALWRWARSNGIPQLGIEVQELEDRPYICNWPVDMLLSKQVRKMSLAPISFPLPPAYFYCCSVRNEPQMEKFLEGEMEQRKKIAWEPGVYYLLMPFHIYYINRCIKMLQELAPLAGQLREANIKLLITCGETMFRRGLYERDIISQGMARWLEPFMPYQVISGASIMDWVWVAEAVLAPYTHSMFEVFAGMGARVIRPGETKGLKDLVLYVRPQEAVAYLLKERRV